jgi:RNA polymerase sigma-70 factor (ECF subfamily)
MANPELSEPINSVVTPLETPACFAGAVGAETCATSRPTIQTLVRDHYRSIYAYAYRLTGTAADAEDLTQQVFLIAQEKLHQIREVEKADRWLFAILRGCFSRNRRKNQRWQASGGDMNVMDIPDLSNQDDGIDRERLQSALRGIPDSFRLVLLMFYFEECSYREIASALGISIGTVMSRLSRAKGRLRGLLLEPATPSRSAGSTENPRTSK